jgi:hypothetical protein
VFFDVLGRNHLSSNRKVVSCFLVTTLRHDVGDSTNRNPAGENVTR